MAGGRCLAARPKSRADRIAEAQGCGKRRQNGSLLGGWSAPTRAASGTSAIDPHKRRFSTSGGRKRHQVELAWYGESNWLGRRLVCPQSEGFWSVDAYRQVARGKRVAQATSARNEYSRPTVAFKANNRSAARSARCRNATRAERKLMNYSDPNAVALLDGVSGPKPRASS